MKYYVFITCSLQIDEDLASGVWEKLDAADPTSPLPSCSIPCLGLGKKKRAKSGSSYSRVEETDEAEQPAVDNQLLWRMWRVTKPLVVAQGIWQLIATLTEFVPSLAMQQIVDFVSSYKTNEEEGVSGKITLFVALLFVGPVIQGIADGRNFHLGRRIGCRVRAHTIHSV